MKIEKILIVLLFLSFTLSFIACSDKEAIGNNKARMQIRLTDDPGDYDAVYVDIQDIKINYSSDTSTGWISLPSVTRGSYNLLSLVNDQDTLLADAELNSGKVEQIRLILGSENYVVVDGQKIKLETPSAQQSGLKINIHQEVNGGMLYKLLLDFDVAKSVHQTGNGKYMLKPTIRAVLEAIGGSLKGYVLPDTVRTAVLAIKGTDTVSTYTLNGGYFLKGLSAGTYSLLFIPTDVAFKTQIKESIVINTNSVTSVDTVRLQK